SDDAQAVLGGTGNVYDIGLDVVGSGATDINALNVANGTNLRRFCVPWLVGDLGTSKAVGGHGPIATPQTGQVCTLDTDCAAYTTQCTTGKCTNGVCHATPKPDNTVCNDGHACTDYPDYCKSGQCVGHPTASCPGLGGACDPFNTPCQNGLICCSGV